MPDFTDLISQAKKMQEKMKETQEALKKIEVEGVSGGNTVKVIMNGDGDLKKFDFDGYALGGLAVGETQEQMFKVLNNTVSSMPRNKPRYLMGVGTPSDILGAVNRGIDMFDCVIPTRSGRTGLAYTWAGKINLRNSKYKKDDTTIEKIIYLRSLNL